MIKVSLNRHTALVLTVLLVLTWTALSADEESSSHGDSSHGDSSHSDGSHSDSSHSDSSHSDSSHGDSSHGDSSHGGSHSSSHSSHAADPSVFVLGNYFDYDYFVVLLSVVGGSAMIFELALSKYERWLKAEGDTFQSTLYDKIVRELMTLGVVSFGLFILQPVVTHGTLFIIFEFSHYVIFFVAIFTVAQLVLLGASTYPIKNAWDIAAYNSKDDVLAGYDDMLAKTRKWSLRIPILGRVSLDVFHFGRHWRWLNSVQYHMARSVFIRQHGRTANFDFARYACLVTDRQILSMANVPLRSWLVLIVLHWIAYGLKEIISSDDEIVAYETWFGFGLILCCLELALLAACMLGMRRIFVKLGADQRNTFGTMGVVLDKIWVAPITQVQHSRQERNTVKSTAPHDAIGSSEEKQQSHPVAGESDGAALGTSQQSGSGSPALQNGKMPRITMRDAFILPSCNMYRTAVEMLMLLNSYHLAVYAVYFISPASKSDTEWFWLILLPLPILFGTLVAYRRVLPLLSLLSTIVMVEPTDVADVEQEASELNKLRRKVVRRVEDLLQLEFEACMKNGEVFPAQTSACFLIKRWDKDGDNILSYQELETGLAEIGLLLSRRQRREFLRLADPDRSGSVDIRELTDLLYDVELELAAAKAARVELAAAGGLKAHKRSSSSALSWRGKGESVGEDEDNFVNDRVENLLSRRASRKQMPH